MYLSKHFHFHDSLDKLQIPLALESVLRNFAQIFFMDLSSTCNGRFLNNCLAFSDKSLFGGT